MYDYRAKVARVVDADTLDLEEIDLGFGMNLRPIPGQPLRVRLDYVDAYETRLGKDTTPEQKQLGLAAKEWMREQVEGRIVRLRTVAAGKRGSFGRWLVWVWNDGDDDEVLDRADSLNMEIIDRGFGVPYER